MSAKVRRADLTNLPRLRKLVTESGLDAVLATSLENVTYTSGLYDLGMRTLTDRLHIVVWPAQGDPAFVAPTYRHGGADIFIEDIRAYDFYARDASLKDERGRPVVDRSPIPLLADVLKEKGLATGRLGIEKMHFPLLRYEELKALLPEAQFVDCGSLFDEVRMIKTPAEVRLLQEAGIATEKAVQAGFELACVGDSSRSIAESISAALLRTGADRLASLHLEVMSGPRRYKFLEEPVKLKKGDLVVFDGGGFFGGYRSDIARMAVVGQPTPEQRSFYRRLYAVQRKVINEVMKPGRSGIELLQMANRTFEEYGFRPHPRSIAHGLGLFIHERPWLREGETYVLEPGTVLCVEILNVDTVTGDPQQMWQVEDLILITEQGAQVLTTYAAHEDLFVIG